MTPTICAAAAAADRIHADARLVEHLQSFLDRRTHTRVARIHQQTCEMQVFVVVNPLRQIDHFFNWRARPLNIRDQIDHHPDRHFVGLCRVR